VGARSAHMMSSGEQPLRRAGSQPSFSTLLLDCERSVNEPPQAFRNTSAPATL